MRDEMENKLFKKWFSAFTKPEILIDKEMGKTWCVGTEEYDYNNFTAFEARDDFMANHAHLSKRSFEAGQSAEREGWESDIKKRITYLDGIQDGENDIIAGEQQGLNDLLNRMKKAKI